MKLINNIIYIGIKIRIKLQNSLQPSDHHQHQCQGRNRTNEFTIQLAVNSRKNPQVPKDCQSVFKRNKKRNEDVFLCVNNFRAPRYMS